MKQKKILIVDDEFYIQNGLTNILPWEALGYTIIGTVSNGAEAIEFCQKEQPDILFTDIMMPKIDGIELTKYVTKHWPKIIIIILSSYNDFDYVKTAIKNGAREYILKPSINGPMIRKILTELCPQEGYPQVSQPLSKQNNQKRSLSDREFSFPYFIGFLIADDHFFHVYEIKELLSSLFTADQQVIIEPINNYFLVLVNHPLKNIATELYPLSVPYIFFSNTIDLDQLMKQVNQAVPFYADFDYYFSDPYFIWDESIRVFQSNQLLSEQKKLLSFIKRNQFSEAIELLQTLTRSSALFLRNDLDNFLKSNIISFVSKLEDILDYSMGQKKIEFLTFTNQLSQQSAVLNRVDSFLNEINQDYLQKNEEANTKKQILDFIHQHYAEGINLASIAEQFHFNYNYLSRSFITFTGLSFTDYLNNVRISEAKRMLQESTLSIAEISQRVGYTDTSYFSKVFKKNARCSPSTYRRQHYD